MGGPGGRKEKGRSEIIVLQLEKQLSVMYSSPSGMCQPKSSDLRSINLVLDSNNSNLVMTSNYLDLRTSFPSVLL